MKKVRPSNSSCVESAEDLEPPSSSPVYSGVPGSRSPEEPRPPFLQQSGESGVSDPRTQGAERRENGFCDRGTEIAVPAGRFEFLKRFFPEASTAQWNDWKWQLKNRFRDLPGFTGILSLTDAEREALSCRASRMPAAVTPYYASLLDPDNPLQPLRKTVISLPDEYVTSEGESDDPLGEEHHSPVPGLVHRYPDRVLFLVTGFCSTYCRYCTRSRIVGQQGEVRFDLSQWQRAIEYIERTPRIRDVLLSGGDPLTLSDERLDWLLSRLARIPHVEFLRLGTKVPVVLPQRITPQLTQVLRKYHPLWMSIHFVHPEELTPEVSEACARLADAGIPLGSQTVLLAGVNDDVDTMRQLVQGLLKMRIRPYYLYQCDPIRGSSHFRTPVSKGIEIIKGLRGHTTGYAVPTYVIDTPGGGGKVPLSLQPVVDRNRNHLMVRNHEGKVFSYPDPFRPTASRLLVGLTYDLRDDYLAAGYSLEETAEFDKISTIEGIENALRCLGYETDRIGNVRALCNRLACGDRWDLVFNIAEGLHGIGRETQVPALLDAYNIPYTFSDSLVLGLTLHKGMTKHVLRDQGIPTPDFFVAEQPSDFDQINLPFPVFVKPVGEGTGKGISVASKALNRAQLRAVGRELLETFRQPVLVETYLSGREFTVGITGTGWKARSLGAIEVTLLPGAEPGAYSYENKENWRNKVAYTLVDDEEALEAERIAVAAWRGLGCRDGGRADLRSDEHGRVHFLEVNPLAGLNPEHSDLPILCGLAGTPYVELIRQIMDSARERVADRETVSRPVAAVQTRTRARRARER